MPDTSGSRIPRFHRIAARAREILTREKLGFGTIALGLGGLALAAPVLAQPVPEHAIGVLLVAAGVLELLHSFRLATDAARHSAYGSGGLTIVMGVLLLNAPFLAGAAVSLFLVGAFLVDGVQRAAAARRAEDRASRRRHLVAALGDLGAAALVLLLRRFATSWTLAFAGALRIFGTAWNIATAPAHGVRDAGRTTAVDLDLPDHPAITRLGQHIVQEEVGRHAADLGWIAALLATLFAIHVGRMQVDWTIVGLVSPLVAVAGDMVMALLLAYGVVVPGRLLLRRWTRAPEHHAWVRLLAALDAGRPLSLYERLVQRLLTHRFRFAVRVRQARYSARAALERGLQIGLPLAAVLAATVPIWGMNWYFDTENWAAGVWNSWAERRVDDWRSAMVRAAAGVRPNGRAGPPRLRSRLQGSPGTATSRSSSSAIPGRATPRSTCCATGSCSREFVTRCGSS